MKKLLTLSLISVFFSLPISLAFAQGLGNDLPEDIKIEVEEEKEFDKENNEQKTEDDSLAESLDVEQNEKEIQPPAQSFWTILGAILIPSFFIIIAYSMLKFFKE